MLCMLEGDGALRRQRHRRHRPGKVHADKAYDIPRCWAACRVRRIIGRITRKQIDLTTSLGRHRWDIERTHAWLNRYRRLTIRSARSILGGCC
jgi:hypothetical protein